MSNTPDLNQFLRKVFVSYVFYHYITWSAVNHAKVWGSFLIQVFLPVDLFTFIVEISKLHLYLYTPVHSRVLISCSTRVQAVSRLMC